MCITLTGVGKYTVSLETEIGTKLIVDPNISSASVSFTIILGTGLTYRAPFVWISSKMLGHRYVPLSNDTNMLTSRS